MPSYVIASKCDGCKAQERTACQYICPNDLMTLDAAGTKAVNRDPSMCWECFNCVKICPTQAIEVRGYSDFVPLGASVSALRSTADILWTVKFRDQQIKPKRFRFPTRRGVGEGEVQPLGHYPTADDSLSSPTLMGEPSGLNTTHGAVRFESLPELDAASRANGGK